MEFSNTLSSACTPLLEKMVLFNLRYSLLRDHFLELCFIYCKFFYLVFFIKSWKQTKKTCPKCCLKSKNGVFKLVQILIVYSIQVGGNGTVSVEKIEPVKTVETHSFLLLRHNVLAIKTNIFEQPIYGCNFFSYKLILLAPTTCILLTTQIAPMPSI